MDTEKARPRDYHDLLVWKKGMALAKQVYQITQVFPDTERFGLVTQMRRAAVSVPSNIAEGQAHNTTGEFIQFLSHAVGSVSELDTQLKLSIELGYCSREKAREAEALILRTAEDDHCPAEEAFQQLLRPSRVSLAVHCPLFTVH